MGRDKPRIPLFLHWRAGAAERKGPAGPPRAQFWGGAQSLLHAIYRLMHLHTFISLRSFSPTLFLLDAATGLKISPKCSLMFLLLNCICSNKIRYSFSHIKEDFFFQGIFPTFFLPPSLNTFFFSSYFQTGLE